MTTRYLISFLGDDRNYQESEYSRVDDTNNTCKRKYAPLAAMELYAIKKAYVVCPNDVAKDSFDRMIAPLPNTISKDIFDAGFGTDINSTTVGMYKSSLYDLIELIVSDPRNQGVEWIFDISLGFRSLPFEAASIIAYLSVVQPDVRVVDTIYAPQISPFGVEPRQFQFQSLTQQTTYNAWTRATDMFIRYGQADLLSKQLEILKQEQSNLDLLIADLETNITGVADALHTANTRRLGECAAHLQRNIRDIKQQAEDSGPLFTLLDRVAGEYAVFIPANDSYHSEIVRQRQVIRWYLAKRNWALAIQLAAEHLILLKQMVDKNIPISATYRTRNLAGKVWYGWIFTNAKDEFIDVENVCNRHIPNIKTAYTAYTQSYMQPLQIWDGKKLTHQYWQDFIAQELDNAQMDAMRELLQLVSNGADLTVMQFDQIQQRIKKGRDQYAKRMFVLENDVDVYRDIMIRIAEGDYSPKDANYAFLCELRTHAQFVADCAILKDTTPIGADIRSARNGMAHIDGGTSPDDIRKMCEQVCTMSEQKYP